MQISIRTVSCVDHFQFCMCMRGQVAICTRLLLLCLFYFILFFGSIEPQLYLPACLNNRGRGRWAGESKRTHTRRVVSVIHLAAWQLVSHRKLHTNVVITYYCGVMKTRFREVQNDSNLHFLRVITHSYTRLVWESSGVI